MSKDFFLFFYKNLNAFQILQVSSAFFSPLFCFFLLLSHLLHVHLIALLTGNGQSDNQRNKLLKVHLAVLVGVQVLHDFVDCCGVLLRLR